MIIIIHFRDRGNDTHEAVVSTPDTAFQLCWALDHSPDILWWRLPHCAEYDLVWYHRENCWKKLSMGGYHATDNH